MILPHDADKSPTKDSKLFAVFVLIVVITIIVCLVS